MASSSIMSSQAVAGAEGSAAARQEAAAARQMDTEDITAETGPLRATAPFRIEAAARVAAARRAAAGAAAVAGVSADAAGIGAAGAADGALADAPASAPRISTSSGELLEEGMQGGFRVIAENVDGTYTVQVFDARGAEIGTVRWSQGLRLVHEGRLPSCVRAMGNLLSAPADLPSRMADVGIQTAALFTLNHELRTDFTSLADAQKRAEAEGRLTRTESGVLREVNELGNAAKHDDLGPGRMIRPAITGSPSTRRVMILSGPADSNAWARLDELVSGFEPCDLHVCPVGDFPMEGANLPPGRTIEVRSPRRRSPSPPPLLSELLRGVRGSRSLPPRRSPWMSDRACLPPSRSPRGVSPYIGRELVRGSESAGRLGIDE